MDSRIKERIIELFKPPPTCGGCKHLIQGPSCMRCDHPNKITYMNITDTCSNCGRKPNIKKGGCGACIGRGLYVYPVLYNTCDCGGFEKLEA